MLLNRIWSEVDNILRKNQNVLNEHIFILSNHNSLKNNQRLKGNEFRATFTSLSVSRAVDSMEKCLKYLKYMVFHIT